MNEVVKFCLIVLVVQIHQSRAFAKPKSSSHNQELQAKPIEAAAVSSSHNQQLQAFAKRKRSSHNQQPQAGARVAAATSSNARKPSRPFNEDCALFKSNDTVALSTGESTYIEIGEIDITDGFSMSMSVLPSPLNHNGILLSVGSTPNFEYYEWKTKAIFTQFLVVEFIFSALALTVKALNTEHLQQIEVYKTWPTPYNIDDAKWHNISVHRDRDNWILQIDRLNVTRQISTRTNVQLLGMPAYIGGRPGYTDHQFQGVIRNLRVNGRNIALGGKKSMHGRVDVWHCTKDETEFFINWIKQSKQHGYA